jgi:dynein light chain LC8-type
MEDPPVEKESPEAELNKLRASHHVRILASQMPKSYEKDAVDVALTAISKNKHLKDIAQHIKQEIDRRHPGSGKATEGVYHCIVGKSFASEYRMGVQGCLGGFTHSHEFR